MKKQFSVLMLILVISICFQQILPSERKDRDRLKDARQTEEWYLPTADKATELYVYEIGRGEPVVVIHGGFGAEHSSLLDAVNGLEDSFRFIFYDQRGSLRSPCKPESVSIENHVLDLEALRKELGLEKITLLAHSNGTLLSMHYLEKYPQNVNRIVFVGPVSPKRGQSYDSAEVDIVNGSQAAFRSFVERAEAKAEYKKAGIDEPRKTAKQQTNLFRISFAAGNIYHVERWRQMKGGKVFWSQEAANATAKTLMRDYDFTTVLAKHPKGITLIAGDHDLADFGNGLWKKISSEVKTIELVIIKNAGHNAWIDEPVIFRNSLRKALAKDSSAPPRPKA